MKKAFAALAFTALAASPALAATVHHRAASQAYAYEPGSAYAPIVPGTVIENGVYAGADPDPNVRLQLRQQAGETWTN